MPANARRFAFSTLLFFGLPLLFIAVFESILWWSGESVPIAQIVARQQRDPVIWQRNYFAQDTALYKKDFLEKRTASIVALGSSRVLKFRAGMFGKSGPQFFNAGGLVRSIADLELYEKSLKSENTPRVILIAIDHWWLNERARDLVQSHYDDVYDWRAHIVAYRAILGSSPEKPRWRARLNKRFLQAMRAKHPERTMGIQARAGGGGLRVDGSKSGREDAPTRPEEWKFGDKEWIERIEQGGEDSEFTGRVSPQRLERLRRVFERMQRRGITILAFAPPQVSFAAAKMDAMPEHRKFWRQYQAALPVLCTQLKIPFCDAVTPQKLGLQDWHMSDAIHGEETLHLHILRAWLKDPRVKKLLPDASRAVEASIKSPLTTIWRADLSGGPAIKTTNGAKPTQAKKLSPAAR